MEIRDAGFDAWILEEEGRVYDLEERLLEYATRIVRLTNALPSTRAGNHVAGQLLRSGTAPLANHGEVQGAESKKDFVHKLGICFKELKECRRWLSLAQRVPLIEPPDRVDPLLNETEELIRILQKASIQPSKDPNDVGIEDN